MLGGVMWEESLKPNNWAVERRTSGSTGSTTVAAHRCSSSAMLLGSGTFANRRPTSCFRRDDNNKIMHGLELSWRRCWLPIYIFCHYYYFFLFIITLHM